jgi:hypothetical protein
LSYRQQGEPAEPGGDPAATVILLLHHWKPVLMGALVALAAFLLWQRVRELRV